MTREEAIDIIKCLAWHARPDEEDIEQAIETLKLEPCEDALSPTVEPVGLEEAKKLIYQEWKSKVAEDNPNQRLLVAYQIAMKALEQEPTTWSLDDAREDFMYDVYNTLDFLPTNNEANRIIDSFDRVTSGLNQQPCEDCISRQAAIDAADDLVVPQESEEI